MSIFDLFLTITIATAAGSAVDFAIRKNATWAGHMVSLGIISLIILLHRCYHHV